MPKPSIATLTPICLSLRRVASACSVSRPVACFNLICHHPADPGSVVGGWAALRVPGHCPRAFSLMHQSI